MAKSRSQKEALLETYKNLLKDSSGFIAVNATGIEASRVVELKKTLKGLGSNITVIKNSLFKIAMDDENHPVEAKDFSNQTAVVSYTEDPTVVAKEIAKVQKDTEAFEAKFGMVDGSFLAGSKVMELATIPSREELLAKLLGTLNAPLSGFASVITGNVRGFVRVIQQVSEQKETSK